MGLIFAENLHENIIGAYPLRHLVFTIPKRLRVYFKYNRKLTKLLYQAAWDAWSSTFAEHPGNSGMIMALHTAGDLLHFHPHIHGLALDGTVDENGQFHKLSAVDDKKLLSLFQQKILLALLKIELIDQDVVDNMLTWEHSGFHVFAGERILPDDSDSSRFLARYLKKSPVSLERMKLIENGLQTEIQIIRKQNDGNETRYYGIYSARSRGAHKSPAIKSLELNPDPEPPKKPVSKNWAIWIKRIYEVDPLTCPKCGENMKIIAFLHDSKEISKLAINPGIQPWRAPPEFTSSGANLVTDLTQLQFTNL